MGVRIPADPHGLPPDSRPFRRAGFVFAGGRSSRMGRDKALLPVETADTTPAGAAHTTLVERIAARVFEAAGNVTLIGPPDRYAHLGIPTVPDRIPDCGPLGGLYTALSVTQADWNLIVACDLVNVTAALFEELFAGAEASEPGNCVALVPSTGVACEPLCAVYHRRLLPAVESAVSHKRFKMQEFVSQIQARMWPAPNPGLFRNVNTPEDWRQQIEALKS